MNIEEAKVRIKIEKKLKNPNPRPVRPNNNCSIGAWLFKQINNANTKSEESKIVNLFE
jgi:hypothetical protein